MQPIYLDYNATTPVDPGVREAMLPYLGEQFGNPSSSHVLGGAASDAIEAARGQVAGLIGSHPKEIIFTSGGTESSNLAIQGAMLRPAAAGDGHLVISAIEHPATVEPARWLERRGVAVSVVGCNQQGVVDPEDVRAALRPTTVLVSIMQANNEIGSIQPIRAIADICRRAGVLVHVDAAQAVGKIDCNVEQLGVDLMTIAGHKCYAPKGIGALYIREGVELEPVLRGASQERGLKPGTENVSMIVGLGQAAELCATNLPAATSKLAALRDKLEAALRESIGPQLSVNGAAAERLPNTLSANFPGVVGADLLANIPRLCASTGAACHSGTTNISATLAAIGLDPQVAQGAVRLSVGRFTTEQEIRAAADWLTEAWRERQS